jgi:acetyl-CoA acetyltransferase
LVLERVARVADAVDMSLIDSIAGFSTAQATAEVQMKVAAHLLKTAQNVQGDIVSKLLSSAMETVEVAASQVASDLGSELDTFA